MEKIIFLRFSVEGHKGNFQSIRTRQENPTHFTLTALRNTTFRDESTTSGVADCTLPTRLTDWNRKPTLTKTIASTASGSFELKPSSSPEWLPPIENQYLLHKLDSTINYKRMPLQTA
uniref:(northern house mosquito) hypothetical protein n=1 Tax=Culex pipiens TaxID=7175 RepID=A0A8D8FNC2_CULPI